MTISQMLNHKETRSMSLKFNRVSVLFLSSLFWLVLFASPAHATYDDLTDGLVGWWKMDETSSPAIDTSGNGRNGTWMDNATNTSGKFGNSITLDGTNDAVNFGDFTNFLNTTNITMSLWIYNPGQTSVACDWREILEHGQDTTGYALRFCGGDNLVEFQYQDTNNNYHQYRSSNILPVNQWTLLTFSFESGKPETAKLYFNGEIQSASWVSGDGTGLLKNVHATLCLGARNASCSYGHTNMRADDVRVYNRALSLAEVRELYRYAPGPVGYWSFDENTSNSTGSESGGNAPSVANSATTTSTGDSTPNVNIPTASVSEGDIMYIAIAITTSGSVGDVLQTPADWTQVTSQALPSTISTPRYYIFRRTVPIGGLGSPVDFTTSPSTSVGFAAVAFAVNGAEAVPNVVGSWNTGTSATHTALAATTTTENTLVLRFYAEDGNAPSSQPTVSSHDPIDWQETTTPGNGTAVFVYSQEQAGIGTTGNADQSSTNEQWAAITIALEPTASEGGDNADIFDRSGNGNHGTINGISESSWVPGKFGSALDFESSSGSSILFTDSPSLSITTDLSISAWIKPESITASTSFIIAQKSDGAYKLEQYGDEVRMYIGSDSNYATTDAANLSTGTWYHVEGIYDASAQTVAIYINGVEEASTLTGTIPSSMSDGSGDLMIGSDSSGATLSRYSYNIYSSGSSYGTGSYSTSSFTPPDNSLLVATIGGIYPGGFDVLSCLTISDSEGLTWTPRVSASNGVSYAIGTKTWTAPVSTGTSMTVSADCGANSMYGYKIGIGIYENYNTSDPTGATANDNSGPTNGSHSITLSASPATTSEVIASIFSDTDSAQGATPATGWTELDETTSASTMLQTQARGDSTSTSVDWDDVNTADGGSVWKTIFTALEIQGEAGSSPYDGRMDEIKIYNYARTQAQIIEDMNGGHPVGGSPVGSQVGYWKFDEGYGDTANDSSPQGNNGDLAGSCPGAGTCPTWSNSGKFGKALNFDGGDYLTADAVTADIAGTDHTYSAWINTTQSSGDGYILAINTSSYANRLHYSVYNGEFVIYDGASRFTNGIAIVNDGSWHHVAAVFDDSENTVTAYVDGQYDQTATETESITATDRFSIGMEWDAGPTASDFYTGLIDEVKIYNVALTPDQIKLEYNRGKSAVFGATSTDSSGNADNSAAREYCIPGDTSYCTPPVAYWSFDENTGTGTNAVKDRSGNNHHGTMYTNMTESDWVPGRFGSAVEFDGVDDRVTVTDHDDFSPDNMTISAWVKYKKLAGDKGGEEFIAENDTFYLEQTYSGSLSRETFSFGWKNSGDTLYTSSYDGDITLTVGERYHVVGVKSSNLVTIYVNGDNVTGWEDSPTGVAKNGTNDLRIGRDIGGSYPTEGLIDDVRIYNYARTPAQVQWDMNKGAPVGWWRLDECSGTTANDASGYGNNGTITIGTSGSNTSAGICSSGTATEAWNNGTDGKRNASLDFDGTDDYVSVTDDPAIDLPNYVTMSAWINLDTVSIAAQNIVSKVSTIASGDITYGIGTSNIAGYYDELFCGDAVSGSFQGFTTGYDGPAVNLQPDTWYHVVCAMDSVNNTLAIYVDGKQVGYTASFLGSPPTGNEPLYIGGVIMDYPLNGQVDDVQIYNYVLTPQQVKTLYNNGAASF